MQDLAKRIAALRTAAGLTQLDVAIALNITDKAVSKWENALSCPDIALLPALADLFHVTIDQLLRGTPRTVQTIQPVNPHNARSLDVINQDYLHDGWHVVSYQLCGDGDGSIAGIVLMEKTVFTS